MNAQRSVCNERKRTATSDGEARAALVDEADALAADGFSGVRAGEPLLRSAYGDSIRDPATACKMDSVFNLGVITL